MSHFSPAGSKPAEIKISPDGQPSISASNLYAGIDN